MRYWNRREKRIWEEWVFHIHAHTKQVWDRAQNHIYNAIRMRLCDSASHWNEIDLCKKVNSNVNTTRFSSFFVYLHLFAQKTIVKLVRFELQNIWFSFCVMVFFLHTTKMYTIYFDPSNYFWQHISSVWDIYLGYCDCKKKK